MKMIKPATDYIWLLWDGIMGLGGWGHDDTKLWRLRGNPESRLHPKRPPRWWDRFTNYIWLAKNIIALYILYSIFYPNKFKEFFDESGAAETKKGFLFLN